MTTIPARPQPSVSAAELDYLGKVHTTLLASGRSANRSFVTGMILNVVYLAFLFGSVAVGTDLDLAGVRVSLSPIVLIVGVHWISTFTFAHGWAAAIAEFKLLQSLRRAYHELSVAVVTEGGGLESPLVLPGINMMIAEPFTHVKRVGRFAGAAIQLAFLFATLILPVVVQAWGTIRAWRLHAAPGWIALLVASGLVTLCYLEIAWHHLKRAEERVFVPE